MKRERNRSGHAAMLCGQTVKCGNGLVVTKDNGYLPALFPVLGLAIRCGFVLHALSPFRNSIASGIASQSDRGTIVLMPFFAYVTRSTRSLPWHTLVEIILSLFLLRQSSVAFRIWKRTFILCLRFGPIPTMRLSYNVTSDMSIGAAA